MRLVFTTVLWAFSSDSYQLSSLWQASTWNGSNIWYIWYICDFWQNVAPRVTVGSCLVVSWCYGTAYTHATLVVTVLFSQHICFCQCMLVSQHETGVVWSFVLWTLCMIYDYMIWLHCKRYRMYHSDWCNWCVYLHNLDICTYIWCASDSLKWWDLFSRRSYELLALILINSAHSDRHRHGMEVTHGTYDTSVISHSMLHPESPWDLVLWSPGATGLHTHMQLLLWPCFFPTHLFLSMYVGIAAWNRCCVIICTLDTLHDLWLYDLTALQKISNVSLWLV